MKHKNLLTIQESLPMPDISGLNYKPTKIINDDSRVVNKLETSLMMMLELSFMIVTCL